MPLHLGERHKPGSGLQAHNQISTCASHSPSRGQSHFCRAGGCWAFILAGRFGKQAMTGRVQLVVGNGFEFVGNATLWREAGSP